MRAVAPADTFDRALAPRSLAAEQRAQQAVQAQVRPALRVHWALEAGGRRESGLQCTGLDGGWGCAFHPQPASKAASVLPPAPPPPSLDA